MTPEVRSTIRLIVADDHPIILEGLVHLLERHEGFEIVGRCTNGAEALAAIRRTRPDIALLDLRMPEKTGLDVLREVHAEQLDTRVILLTAEISGDETLQAVRLGVGGVVLKETISRELVQSIRTVAAGGQAVDSASVHSALEQMLRREAGATSAARLLTRREIEIVKMVAAGLRNREIAAQLSISESTVKIHVHSIYQKLGVSGRVELSNFARANALV